MSISDNFLPVLPLRDMVLLPGVVVSIFVGRPRSYRALSAASNSPGDNYVIVLTQKHYEQDEPSQKDLYQVGVLAKIIQTIKLPGDNAKVVLEGIERVRVLEIHKDDFLVSRYEIVPDQNIEQTNEEVQNILAKIIKVFIKYSENNKKVSKDALLALTEKNDLNHGINVIISHLDITLKTKQILLEETDTLQRSQGLLTVLENSILQTETDKILQGHVKKQIEKTQREYYLNEQMKAIQKELDGDDKSEFSELEEKIRKLKLPKDIDEKISSELKKLKNMNPMSAESSVIRNYLDVVLSMPWGKKDKSSIDIKKAAKTLDREHFGLDKPKERILEYLAILERSQKIKGPILCFIGPPGVGKTSLVKSIAESMGRKYVKFSLGGVRDEAEIRGHRKTYLGSMPGRIINLIRKAKVDNPVILLDEIDKMGSDFRGDPTSALLEVLDPEQNTEFVDHYLEVPYNLSDILFIATANSYDLPRPLLDRMEIINISGYIEEEKLQIAKNYLLPKQIKLHGMKPEEISASDTTILDIIRYYTKESGVRSLEREISALCRKALKDILTEKDLHSVEITPKDLEKYLGVKKYRFGLAESEDKIGVTTGLAYTELGGDLLSIEALAFPGKGEIKTTGRLGDVMKESAQAAYSCFRNRASYFGIKYEDYKDVDIHLHVPEGAIPKDGPSAGTALFTTIVSLMTKIPVKKELAMTGEITLSGKVLPIGGLKEKLLAASRGGIKTVLIPEDNKKDLKEIPKYITEKLKIMPVSNIDQVLDIALAKSS